MNQTLRFFILLSFFSFMSIHTHANEPCDLVYHPGQVGSDQTICLDDNTPLVLQSIAPANYGVGNFEYMWIKSTIDPDSPNVVWLSIPGATGSTLDIGPLAQTTWFRRCTRPTGCAIYGSETNTIKVTVETCIDPCLAFALTVANTRNPSCYESNDGKIELNIEGGLPPYSIHWNGTNATSLIADNLTKGAYSVEIIDANGCYQSQTFTLGAPDALKVSFFKRDATCNGAQDGLINLSVDGGTWPYTYTIDGTSQQDDVFDNLPAGWYNITVSDKNNCHKTLELEIKEPEALTVDGFVSHESCYTNDGQIEVAVNGGTTPYTYKWNNNETSNTLFDLDAGLYSLIIKDKNQCATLFEATILDECKKVEIDFSTNQAIANANQTVTLDWIVYNEKSNGIYFIEHSLDGTTYLTKGDPIYAKELTATANAYQFIDASPRNGLNFYRIKYLSIDGEIAYSTTQSIYLEIEGLPTISVYPNPVVDQVTIDFLQPIQNQRHIDIIDAFGRTVRQATVNEGNRFSTIDVAQLTGGTYMVKLQDAHKEKTLLLVKE